MFHNGVIKAWLRVDFWMALCHIVPGFDLYFLFFCSQDKDSCDEMFDYVLYPSRN